MDQRFVDVRCEDSRGLHVVLVFAQDVPEELCPPGTRFAGLHGRRAALIVGENTLRLGHGPKQALCTPQDSGWDHHAGPWSAFRCQPVAHGWEPVPFRAEEEAKRAAVLITLQSLITFGNYSN